MQTTDKAIVNTSIATFLVFGLSAYAVTAKAAECDPEPTDMFVKYGETINCEINPEADTDFFRISGNAGDRVIIEALDSNPDRFFATIFLVAPDGTTLKTGHNSLEVTLPDTGMYTAEIFDTGRNDIGEYAFTAYCVAGSCSPIPPDVSDPASIDLNLDIHIPSATYQSLGGTLDIWADLEFKGVDSDGDYIWRLKDFGVNQ